MNYIKEYIKQKSIYGCNKIKSTMSLLPYKGYLSASLLLLFLLLSIVNCMWASLLAPFALIGAIIMACGEHIFEHAKKWVSSITIELELNRMFSQAIRLDPSGVIINNIDVSKAVRGEDKSLTITIGNKSNKDIKLNKVEFYITRNDYIDTFYSSRPDYTISHPIVIKKYSRGAIEIPFEYIDDNSFVYINNIIVEFDATPMCLFSGDFVKRIALEKETINSINNAVYTLKTLYGRIKSAVAKVTVTAGS